MNSFLVPIKVLVEMGVRTRSTYVAAMEGIELSMIKFLKDLGYDYENRKFDGLYRLPGKERLAIQNAKYDAFVANPKVGVSEFVQFISKTLDQYFDNIYIGRVLDMSVSEDAIVNVKVSALLHSKFTDKNRLGAEVEFEEKLDVLASHGLEFEKVNRATHYQMKDHDKNREIIENLLSVRGAYGIGFLIKSGYIREISFRFHAKDIGRWFVYTPAKSEVSDLPVELNDGDIGNINQCLFHIPHALNAAFADEKLKETCCYVAEGQFCDLCRCVGYNGILLKTMDERYREEREANAKIRDIVDIIGSEFPVEACEEVTTETRSDLMRFFISKMHSVVQDYSINRLGDVELKIKWIGDPDDLIYYVDEEELLGKTVTPLKNIESVFDIVDDRGIMVLCDNSKNRKRILDIIAEWPSMRIKNINVECRDDLHNLFTITEMNVVVENVVNVFHK